MAFYEAHFSQGALSSFGSNFLNPTGEDQPQDEVWEEEEDDDDDGLGYYEDGVKRTLTDEQIEIFRHSELEELRKQQEKRASGKGSTSADDAMDSSEATSTPSGVAQSSQNTRMRKKKGKKAVKREPKPDLRKRTWDVVDKGLDSLDYD